MASRNFRRFLPLLLTLLCAGAVLFVGHWWSQVTSPRVVAHAMMPNGVEIVIEQTFNWELFYTSFYYRPPGGNWVWRYYSHEDGYWGRGPVELDESSKSATVYRDGKPTIKFNWSDLSHTQLTETQSGKPRTFTKDQDR